MPPPPNKDEKPISTRDKRTGLELVGKFAEKVSIDRCLAQGDWAKLIMKLGSVFAVLAIGYILVNLDLTKKPAFASSAAGRNPRIIYVTVPGQIYRGGAAQTIKPVFLGPELENVLTAAEQTFRVPKEILKAMLFSESGNGASIGNFTPAQKCNAHERGALVEICRETGCKYLEVPVNAMCCIGPMQFKPTSWNSVKIDANNDKIRNPFDAADAIMGAAALLVKYEWYKNYRKALNRYGGDNRNINKIDPNNPQYYEKIAKIAKNKFNWDGNPY